MWRALLLVFFFILPLSAVAEDPISRRDGWLLIWSTIARPAYESRETPFLDVLEGDRGFVEITYGKSRGLIDDTPDFRPDDPLTLPQALLWLYRTRNIADLDDMTLGDLPALVERYPIAHTQGNEYRELTETELIELIRGLTTMLNEEVHEISFYAESFQGRGTAFGESFDMHAITAAHRTFPYNTLVKVINVDNAKSVVVRINDRGPYVHGRDMDLSLASFNIISNRSRGIGRATFERLGDVNIVSKCALAPRYQKRITRDARFHTGVPHTLPLGSTMTLGANRPFVVRSVVYPDGFMSRIEDWIVGEETYTFTPAHPGRYTFYIASGRGRGREFNLEVVECDHHINQ